MIRSFVRFVSVVSLSSSADLALEGTLGLDGLADDAVEKSLLLDGEVEQARALSNDGLGVSHKLLHLLLRLEEVVLLSVLAHLSEEASRHGEEREGLNSSRAAERSLDTWCGDLETPLVVAHIAVHLNSGAWCWERALGADLGWARANWKIWDLEWRGVLLVVVALLGEFEGVCGLSVYDSGFGVDDGLPSSDSGSLSWR